MALSQEEKEAISEAVSEAVSKSMEPYKPILEAWKGWVSVKKIAATIVGIIIALGALVSFSQNIWSIISHHFILKP